MGGGSYSVTSRTRRAVSKGYASKDSAIRSGLADSSYVATSSADIFTNKSMVREMSPVDIKVREACDSKEHPNSVPIIIGLDVTGSMGKVPLHLVRDGLPHVMGNIIQRGVPDPQLLFLGIGDHECDRSPLQVGQYESSDELVDHWLTNMYLEGGGGGNYGESYLLAWYFAAKYTRIDSFEKRGKRGILFTIGDEPPLKDLPVRAQKGLMGANGQYKDCTAAELVDEARESYEVFHIHLDHHGNFGRSSDLSDWKQLMQDNLIVVKDHKDIPTVIADKVVEVLKHQGYKMASIDDDEPPVEETSDDEPKKEKTPGKIRL